MTEGGNLTLGRGNPPGSFSIQWTSSLETVPCFLVVKICLNHLPVLRGLWWSHLVCESFASAPAVASPVCWCQVAEQLAAVGYGVEVVGGESERVRVWECHVDWFSAEVAGPASVAGCLAQRCGFGAVAAVTVFGRSRHSRTCFR